MFSDAVKAHRGDDVAAPLAMSIMKREAIEQVAQCDAIFCCVDRLDARLYGDLISSCFLIPLFDVGVSIPTAEQLLLQASWPRAWLPLSWARL